MPKKTDSEILDALDKAESAGVTYAMTHKQEPNVPQALAALRRAKVKVPRADQRMYLIAFSRGWESVS